MLSALQFTVVGVMGHILRLGAPSGLTAPSSRKQPQTDCEYGRSLDLTVMSSPLFLPSQRKGPVPLLLKIARVTY